MIKKIAASLLLALAVPVAAQQISPMTKAILDTYAEALAQNPKDYLTLYDRAATYFGLAMYDDALTDIGNAIVNTPAKEAEQLAAEYSLMADIEIQLKEYGKALTTVEKSIELTPEPYAELYRKGNICLYLDRPEEAWKAFSSMQRLKSRSQEAYFGMAKADIMMGKKDEAKTLIKQAQDADPNSWVTYCRTGDLYRDLGEDENAAADYLSAFSLADGSPRPMESLINLGRDNYPAVASAINYALKKTDNPVPLDFLKANIAYITGNYTDALEGFNDLLKNNEAQIASIYSRAAQSALALNKTDVAEEYIGKAVFEAPTAENYIIQSDILRAAGKNEAAFGSATKAKGAEPHNPKALTAVALTRMAFGDWEEAVEALNEAIINDATDLRPLMLRAYILNTKLKNAKGAAADYARVANSPAETFPDVALKAMAKSLNGKKLDGDAIIEQALTQNTGKDAAYWAAVYYANTGSLEKGAGQLKRARGLGYQNLYNIEVNTEGNLNIAPVRHLLK